MDYERELQIAREAAAEATAYLRNAYDAFVPIPDAPSSISTDADRGSQAIILRRLAEAFPDDVVCAEEGAAARVDVAAGKRLWVVDPIDGTKGFAVKNGEFSVMIGLVSGGRVVVGVVAEPAFSRTTYARFGYGCWVQTGDDLPRGCLVTRTLGLGSATLVQSHARTGETPWPVTALGPKRVVETYSAGVKMAMVARGEVDLYVNTYANFSDWDICAGEVLIAEAGGMATEISGQPLRYGTPGFAQTGGLLASNGRLHPAALDKLKTQR